MTNPISILQRVVGDRWDVRLFPGVITIHHRDNSMVHLRIETKDHRGNPCFLIKTVTNNCLDPTRPSEYADYYKMVAALFSDPSVKRAKDALLPTPRYR